MGASLVEVWDADGYAVLSSFQKLGGYRCRVTILPLIFYAKGAILYYFSTMDAMEKLKNPKYYDQEYWLNR